MGHIVELLKKHGIRDVVSVLYFNPEQITSYFGTGAEFDISMSYTTAVADFGTAGAVKNAQGSLDETFIIISGDVLTDFDISKAVAFHREKGAMATILLTRVPEPLQYGIVMTDATGRITRFLEKPSWGEVFSDTINTGIYILEPSVLDLIPPATEFDFSKDLYPLMLKNGLPLYGYVANGYWKDIGNLHEYQLAHDDVLAGKVNIDVEMQPNNLVVGKNVHIGEGATLTNCVIGDDCIIGAGATLQHSVLWKGVRVGEYADIAHSVLCTDVHVGANAVLLDNVVVAEGCVIGDHARILANIKLWPRKHVESHATLTRSLVQEERWSRELFADARISGIANIDMNPEFGAKLGAALGNAVGKDMMLVASRDADPVSRIMKRSITAGLMSVGCDVTDLQQTSIPQTRQEMLSGRYVAGFHIRRSPRDPNKTDIILFAKDGRDIPISMTKTIERYFYGEDIKRVPQAEVGQLRFPERSLETYVQRFLEMIDVTLVGNRSFKLLADYSFGLSSQVFPSILGELHCKVLSMNSYVDASHFADPLTDVLDESAVIMRSLGYELGFKIDPSSEKIAMVDERGIWYTGLRLLTIVTKLWLDTHRHMEPYTIAVPVQATNEIEQIAADYDVRVVRIRNSHGAMMEATKDENVQFVGGTRGGFIFPRFLFAADGMYSACQILEMLAKTGYQLSDLDRRLPKRFQRSVAVHCPWESKGTVMRRSMEHSEDKERQLIDGVKIFLGSASVLLVPDKEAPTFMVTAEADTDAEAESLMNEYAYHVAQWRDLQ